MRPTLSDLETLARQAGEILRAGHGRQHKVEYKGVINLVTEVDQRSEDYLIRNIRERFPSHSIVAEESGTLSGEASQVWYIDPLDGTVNFSHGLPFFCVSLAYEENGGMHLGVVYDPLLDECFSAERGVGAWLNGESIQVSKTNELDKSLLVTGFPYDIRTNPNNNLDHYANFSVRSQAVRRFGSAALELCYVANGRFDGFWEIRLSAWDVAAGGLIAQEAGARVTNLHGEGDYISAPQSIVAANHFIHPQMLSVLNPNK
jgi:myo-inositol-1(or 4)-monophosphatase